MSSPTHAINISLFNYKYVVHIINMTLRISKTFKSECRLCVILLNLKNNEASSSHIRNLVLKLKIAILRQLFEWLVINIKTMTSFSETCCNCTLHFIIIINSFCFNEKNFRYDLSSLIH